MEAFLSVSRKELQKRVLLQYDFRQSKVTRFALILYLLSFLACEIPLLATDCECTNDLPDYLYILRLVFVAIAFTILIISKPEPNSYRIYEDVLKVVVFTGILFTTSYNFGESQESRSKFYGVNPFWEGVDISFYLLIVSVFIIRNWWFRSISIAINFIIAVVAKNINERDLYYIIKLAGILAACALLMHSLERDFRLLYLRKLHYKQEEQAWRRLIDTLPEGVMVINTAKEVMFYNKGIADFVPIGNEKKPLEKQLSKVMQEIHQLKCRDQFPNADFEFLTTNIDSKGSGHTEAVPLTLSSKAMALGTKMSSVHDDREETTYSSTLWTQVSFFLQNYEECKTRNIGWNSDKGETSFITFEGRYQDRVLEIKIAFTPFDYQECIIIVLRDTSDRNTIALLEANDKYKSLVLASVSHELRTPLSNTFNMVTFAFESEGTTTEVKNQFLQPALISLKMLLGLVNDILDYSQINENKFRLVYQDVDIPKVLEETSNLMKLQAAKKGIQLFTEIEDDIPNPFHTDPNRLTQIMLNLLSNALKFTLNGYIKISAKIQDCNYDLIEISVEDTGIGMSVEDQAQLFQNYTKIEIQEKAKLNASGCGLGLAISNTLAKALARGEEDSIKVSSELGKGSKFVFLVQNKANEFSEKKKLKSFNELKSPATKHQKMLMNKFSEQTQRRSEDFIPLQVDEKDYSKKKSEHHALAKSIVEFYRTNLDVSNPGADIRSPGISKPKRKKSSFELPEILIVDDDSFNILSLETILKSLGYTFTHAYNGKQAIEKIIERSNNRTNEGFKLVFMDCNMPIMDGFEATQELRAKMANGEIGHIPIIGCTAYNHEETIQQCHENQMDGVICKPASKAKVAEMLERFIVKDL